MNVIKVYGGLGNQFFQYAFGKVLNARGHETTYDITHYRIPQDPPRPYSLDKFYTNVTTGLLKPRNRVINEVRLNYIKDPLMLDLEDVNFQGYWQHPSYYTGIMPELKKEFRVNPKFYTELYIQFKEKIICSDSVSLHVRRGDYVSINGHHLLGADYYTAALALFPGKRVFVFSDDIPWCIENFRGNQFSFVNIDQEYLALELMRYCKHQIIANSTFSWWAGVLNSNPDKKVVTPTRWRVNEKEQQIMDSDLFWPEGWIRVKG